MFVSERILGFLESLGVSHLFGIPGYAVLPLYARLGASSLRHVLVRHEEGAGFMAYGFGAVGEGIAACVATSGGASCHLIPALATAFANSVPLVAITGLPDTPRLRRNSVQNTSGMHPRAPNIMEMMASVTVFSELLMDASQLEATLERMAESLRQPRKGPVHLCVPADVFWKEVPARPQLPFEKTPLVATSPGGSGHELADVAAALARARRPLLLVGRGCHSSRAALGRFLEMSQFPYASTLQGKGIVPHDSPLHLGCVGNAGSRRANTWLREQADVLLILGSSLNEFTTQGFTLDKLAETKILQIDVDETSFCESASLKIRADVGVVLEGLMASEKGVFSEKPKPWLEKIEQIRAAIPACEPVAREFDHLPGIAPMDVIAELERSSRDDAIFLADSGNNALWALHYLSLRRGQSFSIDVNMGCMGSGILSAIGVQLAWPQRQVVCICGDGSFMMSGLDIATAVENSLPIVWAVLNDAKLGMIEQTMENVFGRAVASSFPRAGIASIAEAMGARAVRLASREGLRSVLGDIAAGKLAGPIVLDIEMNDAYLPRVFSRVKAPPARRGAREVGCSAS